MRVGRSSSGKIIKGFSQFKKVAAGFSLIELVVVIAILGILIAIALPNFLNIQKDAKVNQAKNALVLIVKECNIASLRDKSTLLSNIPSARGSLPDFWLSSQGRTGVDFLSRDCFQTIGGKSVIQVDAIAGQTRAIGLQKFPMFSINYDIASGNVTRTCLVKESTDYKGGCAGASFLPCDEDEFGQVICPPENGKGTW